MLSNRSRTLGGEGCPAADIARTAENRNNYAVSSEGTLQVCEGSTRTAHERTGSVDTRLAQQTEKDVHAASRREIGSVRRAYRSWLSRQKQKPRNGAQSPGLRRSLPVRLLWRVPKPITETLERSVKRSGVMSASAYNGSIPSLIDCYRTDPDSSYRKNLRHFTRRNYNGLCDRLIADCTDPEIVTGFVDELGCPVAVCAPIMISAIKSRLLLRWSDTWAYGGRIAMAHGLIAMLRIVMTFGATILEDPECRRVKTLLHDMRFKMSKPRSERMTFEQVEAIRKKAHEFGHPSIALAQAIQFECTFRQKDVIGEWVPFNEPGTTEIIDEKHGKWHRGIRWSEIDSNLILRHVTSKRQKLVEIDLKLAPMVMAELRLLYPYFDWTDEYTGIHHVGLEYLPTSGAIIISEKTGLPYVDYHFRYLWRLIAKAAGVPDRVFNMDSRAGAISEAIESGVPLELVRHAATHGDISMTQKYDRAGPEATARAMRTRAENRKSIAS